MTWNKWFRQIHRWLSIAFTAAVIVNIVVIFMRRLVAHSSPILA